MVIAALRYSSLYRKEKERCLVFLAICAVHSHPSPFASSLDYFQIPRL